VNAPVRIESLGKNHQVGGRTKKGKTIRSRERVGEKHPPHDRFLARRASRLVFFLAGKKIAHLVNPQLTRFKPISGKLFADIKETRISKRGLNNKEGPREGLFLEGMYRKSFLSVTATLWKDNSHLFTKQHGGSGHVMEQRKEYHV